jgi:hypothetical protein
MSWNAIYRPAKFRLKTGGLRTNAQMSGPLRTPEPTSALHGATKNFVDTRAALQSREDSANLPYGHTNVDTALWYPAPPMSDRAVASFTPTRGKAGLLPVWLGRSKTWAFDGLQSRVTAATAGGLVRLGIFQLDRENGFLPTALLLDAGTIDASTTGIKNLTFTAIQTTNIQWIALAWQYEGAAAPVNALSAQTIGNPSRDLLGLSSPAPGTAANQE